MGTKSLADIHKDLKLLITSISGFEVRNFKDYECNLIIMFLNNNF